MNRNLPVKQFNEIKKTFQATKKNGFVTAVNARIVHEWLGVGRDFTTWIKERIERYKFIEHIDYCIVDNLSSPDSGSAKARKQIRKEYHCTPEMVKQLAMVESSDKGQTVRLYFLDCELVAHKLLEQKEERSKLSVEYKPMTKAIQDFHEDPRPYHYSNEADMINRIVLGCSAAKFKKSNDIGQNESVRDYMTQLQMEAVVSLQRANTFMLEMCEPYEDRKEKLNKLFNFKHSSKLIDEVHLINA